MNKKDHIWPDFHDQSNKTPFEVPENYFDHLEDRIEARIASETESISPKRKLMRMMKPVLAMAASFALVFLLVYYPLSVFLPNYLARNIEVPAEQTDTLSADEIIISYISTSGQSDYDILLYDEEELEEIVIDSEEMFTYLDLAMNETEIFAELQN